MTVHDPPPLQDAEMQATVHISLPRFLQGPKLPVRGEPPTSYHPEGLRSVGRAFGSNLAADLP